MAQSVALDCRRYTTLPFTDVLLSKTHFPNITAHMEGDVNAVTEYGFNGIKLDGCGEFMDLDWWAKLLNATGRPILIENCHWGEIGGACNGVISSSHSVCFLPS